MPVFMEAVILEAGNPTLLVTQNQLRTRLIKAAETVLEKAKLATIPVMS